MVDSLYSLSCFSSVSFALCYLKMLMFKGQHSKQVFPQFYLEQRNPSTGNKKKVLFFLINLKSFIFLVAFDLLTFKSLVFYFPSCGIFYFFFKLPYIQWALPSLLSSLIVLLEEVQISKLILSFTHKQFFFIV